MKALAIDLGGTHANCAVLADRQILASEHLSLDSKGRLADALPLFARTLTGLADRCGVPLADCAGLALSFCGLVDSRAGRVTSTNEKYEDAPSLDLARWARESLGLRFRMENDARMALLGEWYAGAARGTDDVVMFTLGTGIGGAAMVEGQLLRGKHFQAGCLGGHFPVLFTGRPCNCGSVGCAEAEAAGWSLPGVARDWPGFAQSALAREPVLGFKQLFHHAERGDPVARAVKDRCLAVWAANTVAAVHAYDPEVVLFGGGVMRSAEAILPFIQDHVARHAWTPWGKVQVRGAKLGNDAGLLGAIPLLEKDE